MSWQGIKNVASGLLGIDSNNKISAKDGSQLTSMTSSQVGLGNVPDIDATNASNISTGTLADVRLSANVTLQGNAFNGASQLVQLDGSSKLPAVDGSQLTGLTKAQVGLGNVQNVDTTIAANVAISGTFTPSDSAIVALDNLQIVAQKSQGQITHALGLAEFKPSNTWYVATNGNDTTGDGSILNPYQTISKALTVSVIGDIINVSDGTYTETVNITQSTLIFANSQAVIVDGDIVVNADNVTLENITYTGLCTIGNSVTPASVSNCTLNNLFCSVLTNINCLIIYGGVSPLILNNFQTTQGIITNDASASGIIYINDSSYIGNINLSADLQVFARNLGIIPNFTYGGTQVCLINGALELVATHNSGTMSLNGIQFCPSFISNADNSTSSNTFNLQNVNFQDPASGSFFPITQNGNCHFSIGAGVSCDPATVFNGTRQDYSTAINMASSYTPTNYTPTNSSVQGSLQGIDTEFGNVLTIIAPPIDSFNTGQSLTAANRTVHITDTGLTFTFPDATTMTVDLEYNIKAINIATATINTFGSQTIDGASSSVLTGYQNITYYSDGSNLFIR